MIGLLLRFDYTPMKREAYIIYKSLIDVLTAYNVKLIGVIPNRLDLVKPVIDTLDGIILCGGDNDLDIDKDIIKYVYDKDIPCLGICMGMQEMSMCNTVKVDNHYNVNHKVKINNSLVYGNRVISVNSRHKETIEDSLIDVVGKSFDNVIEMIEDKNKLFFVGVQWHPENINDINSKILFDKFIECTKKRNMNNCIKKMA